MHMCGRYSIAVEAEELEKHFGARFVGAHTPRYNAVPSQTLPVILNESPANISMVRWGLRPPWIRSLKRDALINVRSDTLKGKATFKNDLLERRCLVLADGFYEWKKVTPKRAIPFRFTRKDHTPVAFAGIWELNKDEKGNVMKTFSIITANADAPVRAIHHRMPVILPAEAESVWLARSTTLPTVWNVLKYPDSKSLVAYEVSRDLNNPRNDSPELLLPVSRAAETAPLDLVDA